MVRINNTLPDMSKLLTWNSGCPAFQLVDNNVRQLFGKTHARGSRRQYGRYSALLSDEDLDGRKERVETLAERRVAIGVWETDGKGKPTVNYCKYDF